MTGNVGTQVSAQSGEHPTLMEEWLRSFLTAAALGVMWSPLTRLATDRGECGVACSRSSLSCRFTVSSTVCSVGSPVGVYLP